MLLELEVKGFALVDHLVLEFDSGLTVLTGETGAGKSIILDSLSFLLGNGLKGDKATEDCRVAGRFSPTSDVQSFLAEHGLPVDDHELLITRERKQGGRTTSRLNGSLVSASQLKNLSSLLVDFHGQHQSYGLTRPSTHLPMLDKIAGEKHAVLLCEYRDHHRDYAAVVREISEIQKAERERLREIEWLKLELEDIDKVKPKLGEVESLEQDIRRRASSEELAQGTASAVAALQDDGGALGPLNEAIASLSNLQNFDDKLMGPVERLLTAEIELREVLGEVREYTQNIEQDSGALDKLQHRAEAIKKLCRKYGPTVEDVLEHQNDGRVKLDRLENSEALLHELQSQKESLAKSLEELADKLSKGRRKAAGALGTELVSELSQLAMPKVVFQVEFEALEEFGPDGIDRAQFLFSPNPGMYPSPLAETASGGELSRVMLALVSVLSRHQQQPTLIFDEIDVGLGGRTAEAVAAKLGRLAKAVQVICVTHLPVVAAAGAGHFVVDKRTGRNKTTVSVKLVEKELRIDEVARMLSGGASQQRARDSAEELLAHANQ